jgi:uncharacterized membrane protein
MNPIRPSFRDINVGPLERALSIAAGAGAILYASARRRRDLRPGPALAGAALLLRGLTGHSLLYRGLGVRTAGQARDYRRGIKVSEMVTVNRPAEELYRLWRRFENLPRIMRHVESVRAGGDGRTHWKVRGPAGSTVEWDAEVVRDIPGELITWQSLPSSPVVHSGSVAFETVPGGAGTEVRVILRYSPPAGAVGAAVAGALGENPAHQVREDLRNFKRQVESGEVGAPAAG